MLIQASANDVVRLEAAIDSEQSPVTDVVLESAHLVMMKLPTNAGEAMLRQSADHDHNSATFDPISFNTQDSIDTIYWGHSGSQLTRQRSGVSEVKDALILGGFWQVRDASNSTRKSPETQFRIDGSSIVQYGGVMSHNRGDQSSSGCWTGGAGSAWVWDVNIQTTHYIQMGGRDRASTSDASTSWEAGQTFLHALDIEAAFAGGAGPQTITTTGIASAEAFGSPTLTPGAVTATATGIASAEAFGTASLSATATVSPAGIASAEAFGSPTLTPGAVTVTATGIASEEAFGTATVQAGSVTATATGIASGEAFGTPTVLAGAVQVSLQSIASAEAFGTPEVQPGEAFITPPPFGGSILGTPNFLGQVGILAVQIFSEEAFGTPTLSVGAAQLSPSGIASGEAFGTLAVQAGAATVSPSGVPTEEALGQPTITSAATVSPTGISSLEALGTAALQATAQVVPSGIVSQEAFGTPELSLEAASIRPTGIISQETIPAPQLFGGAQIPVVGGRVVAGGQSRVLATVATSTAIAATQQISAFGIASQASTVWTVRQRTIISGGPR
jgi:hypothetical protein